MITQHAQFCVLLNASARHYFKTFTYSNTLKSHNIILYILFLLTFYERKHWSTDWSSNLPYNVFEESDGVRMVTPAVFWIPLAVWEHFGRLNNIPLDDYITLLTAECLDCWQTLPQTWKYDQRQDFQERNY